MRIKLTALVLCLGMLAGILAGCGGPKPSGGGEKISVVATIFPVYDWLREIVGEESERVELTMLLDNGVDLHSYQPSADDIVKISACDLFVCVGGESDRWVDDALKEAVNKDMTVVKLLDVLGDAAKEEETVDGMQTEEEEEDPEYDEHLWLSLKNAASLTELLSERLGEIDPDRRDTYAENADAYLKQLRSLDADYQAAIGAAPVKTLLFGDRFPFRYLTDDYGLSYYAAFPGCSAETEASFETVVFLAGKLDELGLGTILQTESADGSIARTIRDATRAKDQKILTLDSLQSVGPEEIENGTTYLSVMKENLDVLKQALQ